MRKGVVREGVVEKLEGFVLKDICMPSSSSPLQGAKLLIRNRLRRKRR